MVLPTQIHWVQHDRCFWISVFFIYCENYVLSWWLPTAKWWAVGHTWWTLLLRIRPSVQPNHGCPSVQSKAWFSTCIFIKKTWNTAMTRSAARAKGFAISTPGKERGQGWCVNVSKCTRETVTDDGDKSKRDAWIIWERFPGTGIGNDSLRKGWGSEHETACWTRAAGNVQCT